MLRLNKVLKLLFLVGMFSGLRAHEEVPTKELSTVAQELVNLRKNDPDISKRFSFKSADVKYYLSLIDLCEYIDTKHSTFEKITQHFFLNLITPLRGLILLPPEKAPKLHSIIADLCQKMDVPYPAVFAVGDVEFFNAFACSFSPSLSLIAVGEKMVSTLSEKELRAVLAHELAHIKHNHVVKKMAVGLGAVSLFLWGYYNFIQWCGDVPVEYETCNYKNQHIKAVESSKKHYGAYAVVGIAGCLGLGVLADKLSRRCEKEADLTALATTNDPDSMIGFLDSTAQFYRDYAAIYQEEYAYLEDKVKTFSQRHPSFGNFLSDRINLYKQLALSQLDENKESATHPSIEARKEYIRQYYKINETN
jgi:Zn-dependent protease with chaperone function